MSQILMLHNLNYSYQIIHCRYNYNTNTCTIINSLLSSLYVFICVLCTKHQEGVYTTETGYGVYGQWIYLNNCTYVQVHWDTLGYIRYTG